MNDYYIDIGNTRIKYTCAKQPFTIQTAKHNDLTPLFGALQRTKHLLIASGRSKKAKQSLSAILAHAAANHIKTDIVAVNPDLLAINYADTSQFGSDRFLNLLATNKRQHKHFCVVSAGTAITLDFYSDKHLGGMILLGLGSQREILIQKTGLTAIDKPDALLGCDTATSIGAGLYIGLQNLITESIARVAKKHNTAFSVLWTGGDAQVLSNGQGVIVETLLFEGMEIYHRSKADKN